MTDEKNQIIKRKKMGFYDLSKEERVVFVAQVTEQIYIDFANNSTINIVKYFSDQDTYIRKTAYLATGRIYKSTVSMQNRIIESLDIMFCLEDYKVRQTVINAAGEIGIFDFDSIKHILETGLSDVQHSVRNAVIGSIKKMGEKNSEPVLNWTSKYILHPDKEIRREICHGLELLGRTHPEAILPMLKELQFEKVKRVRNMLIHVIGQISYKKNCLAKVVEHLNTWENKAIVQECAIEIIDVHKSYQKFAALSPDQASVYIIDNIK